MMNTRKNFISTSARNLLALLSKGDILVRNNGKSMVGMLKRAVQPLVVRWNDSLVVGLIHFSRECSRLAKSSGIKYLVTYLKACQVLLQQSVGGYKIISTRPLKAAVSRTSSGLPRLIPASHRTKVRMGNRQIIRIGMTLFGLYRVLEFPGSLSIKTIVAPGKTLSGDLIMEFRTFILDTFGVSLKGATFSKVAVQANTRNKRGKIDLGTPLIADLKPTPYVIRKSSPSTSVDLEDQGSQGRDISTSPMALKKAAACGVHGVGTQKVFGPDTLGDVMKNWIKYSKSPGLKTMIEGLAQDYMSENQNRVPLTTLGKLGTKEEAAGKVRVFAMVDAFTQGIFAPLHKNLFNLLRSFKQDGTFDQHRPVMDLLSNPSVKGLWSYDLSAATDRLPIAIQETILLPVLGLHGTGAWSTLLVKRSYSLKGVSDSINYAVGQPMGALSSGAMLALTHHALVQFAGYRICLRNGVKYRWFKLYAVLGDDIIIGNQEVAQEYLVIMDQLGVEIGLAKSLVSPNKLVGEFAKRFYIPKDASMVPIKESIAAGFNGNEFAEYCRKYNVSIAQALRVANFGHKALALNKLFAKTGKRLRNTLLLMSSPVSHLGFDWPHFFNLKGGKMLASSNSKRILQSLRDQLFAAIERQLVAAKPLADGAGELKMYKANKKLGRPYKEWTPLSGNVRNGDRLYALLESEIDDFSYKYSQLVQKHKEMPSMPLNGNSFLEGMDIQQSVSALVSEKSLVQAKLRDGESFSVPVSQVKVVSNYGKVAQMSRRK